MAISNKNRYTFTAEMTSCDWTKDEWPEDYKIEVSINSDSSLTQVITGFRMFLKACEYSETQIDTMLYEKDFGDGN